jgi:hypothetical protein
MVHGLLHKIFRKRQQSQSEASIELCRIATYDEYATHLNKMISEYNLRRQIERTLIANHDSFTVAGWCFVCRKQVGFHVDFSYSYHVDGELTPNWREHLNCTSCGLNNRMRAAIQIFEQECFPHELNQIYVTEQSTPLFQAMQARYPNLNGSEYLGDRVPFGTTDSKGIRNESIVNLTFPSNTFDHILSFDVLEHVPDYKHGFVECLRCLKPGGSLLFTVPFTAKPDTLVRARKNSDGTISHLLPPEYHGDPLNTQGCLCFYHFGWDFLDELRNLGFQDTLALIYWSRELGYLGNGSQIIFKAQKPL